MIGVLDQAVVVGKAVDLVQVPIRPIRQAEDGKIDC